MKKFLAAHLCFPHTRQRMLSVRSDLGERLFHVRHQQGHVETEKMFVIASFCSNKEVTFLERMSLADSWEWLKKHTNFVEENEPVPTGFTTAGWDNKNIGSGIAYYKGGEINDPAEGEEYGLWLLENLTMPAVFFSRCELADMSFRNTSLTGSFFCYNDFIDVDFTNADLTRCDLRCSIYQNVQFVRTDLRDSDLRASTFENCDFTDANMLGAKMLRSEAKELLLSERQRKDIRWMRGYGRIPRD